MSWVPVLGAADLGPAERRPIERDGRRIALWRTASGRLAACDARCPHQWSDLVDEGVVAGEELVCTAHHWRFDVGGRGSKVNVKGRRDPTADVATVPVRVRDGQIELDLQP